MAGRPRGQPKTGGRSKGTLNKATADVKAMAGKHTAKAIKRLAGLIDSDDEKVAVAASNAILDRAVGKPAQAITGAGGEPLLGTVLDLIDGRTRGLPERDR